MIDLKQGYFLVLFLVLVDYLAGLQEEHNAKVELSTTNYA